MCEVGLVCQKALSTLNEKIDYMPVSKPTKDSCIINGQSVQLTMKGAGKAFDMWKLSWSGDCAVKLRRDAALKKMLGT